MIQKSEMFSLLFQPQGGRLKESDMGRQLTQFRVQSLCFTSDVLFSRTINRQLDLVAKC